MNNEHDHLNECLERLLYGEDLESCLKDYPEEAEELRAFLNITSAIKHYAETTKPRPQFVNQTQTKLGIAYQQKYYTRKAQPASSFKLGRLMTAISLSIAAIAIIFTTGFAVSIQASANAMPGDAMYPVKLFTEQVRLNLAFSNDAKVSYLTQFAETRAEEIVRAAAKGDSSKIEGTLEKLDDHLAEVVDITGIIVADEYNLSKLQKIKDVVEASSSRAKAKLQKIEELPQNDKSKIIDNVGKGYSRAIDAIEAAKDNKNNKPNK